MNEKQDQHWVTTAKTYPTRVPHYEDQEGKALLDAIARKWGCSATAALRRMTRETAQREGIG